MKTNRKPSTLKKSLLLLGLWLLAGCAGAVATTPAVRPQPTSGISTGVPPTQAAPTQASPTQAAAQSMPVNWSGHALSGRLLLIQYHDSGDTLIELDLKTGSIQTIYQAPNQSKLLAADLSPDGKQAVLAYAAPKNGEIQLGNTDLYLLTMGSQEQPRFLAQRKDSDESFFGPLWAPDGKAIVYAHFFKTLVNNNAVYKYQIERMDLNGAAQPLLVDSFWPAVSPDGSKIAYVYSDPKTFSNDLFIADANGQNKKPLTTPGVTPPVDAHLFSRDGKTVYFSMVDSQTPLASNGLLDFLGIKTVSAHNVPSDWYKVPVSGGKIERVTNVNDTGMSGAISPDGARLAFISMNGLFAVNTDGSDLVKLSDWTFEGSISWLP